MAVDRIDDLDLTAVLGGTVEAGVLPAAPSPGTSGERPGQLGRRTGDPWAGGVVPIEETAEEAVEEEAEVNGNSVEPEEVDDEKFKEKLECNYAFGEVDVDHVYTNSQNIF